MAVKNFTNNNIGSYELENGHVDYCPKFMTTHFSNQLFNQLSQLNFKQSTIKIYNKTVLTPRLQAWMGNPDTKAHLYTEQTANPWSNDMLILKNKLEEVTNFNFNYVLINYYRDGNDYIAYHSDNESIGEGKNVIASISLGATRQFVLKNNTTKIKQSFMLENGSLIIMKGDETQQYWKHTITKTKKIDTPRINLTFRHS
jgi:alkylated DNA repair dioxygenase AlkB